jgi:hypothetical protein
MPFNFFIDSVHTTMCIPSFCWCNKFCINDQRSWWMLYYQVLLKALTLFCETSTCREGDLAWRDLLALKIRVCLFQFCDAAEMAITHKSFSEIWLHTRKKKEKKKILLYFWLWTGTHHKNLMIWNFVSFKIWRIWAVLLIKNPLYRLKSYFSCWNLANFWAPPPKKKKKNHGDKSNWKFLFPFF